MSVAYRFRRNWTILRELFTQTDVMNEKVSAEYQVELWRVYPKLAETWDKMFSANSVRISDGGHEA